MKCNTVGGFLDHGNCPCVVTLKVSQNISTRDYKQKKILEVAAWLVTGQIAITKNNVH